MANAYFYSNVAVATTLSGNISNSATSADVDSTVGWPTSFPFVIAIDSGAANEELVLVTNNVSDTLTITRGFGGTSAVAHSTGAVVRHAYNAVDATDFRTHEAATTGVHGVTGDIVGTTATQTLTNKTLTAPTVNGGALSGTFTGSPTFNSGTPIFDSTNGALFQRSDPTFVALRTSASGDANDRLQVRSDGRLSWGSGSAATDTILYRESANTLTTEDTFRIYGSGTGSNALSVRVTGDTNSRLLVNADGSLSWGNGSGVVDTNLYRLSASVLKSDDSLELGGYLLATGAIAGAVETDTGITPASGWSVTTEIFRQTCGVKFANITLTRSGSTISNPGGSNGNITPDLQVCSGVPAAWRPGSAVYFMAATGVNHGAGRINTDGTVDLTDWEPGQDINNGVNLRLSWTFL